MPEFIMEGRDHATRNESSFVYGFIEALFFTETSHYTSDVWFNDETQKAIEEGTSDGNIPADCGYSELADSSLELIRKFCDEWRNANAAAIAEILERNPDYDETQFGRDFFYEHVGHGIGFSDRDELDSDDADKLSDMAGHGEVNPYYDHDERVHVSIY